jgi:L-serine dehydratase
MDSIRELYKIGHGPSSSHTMGPGRAAALFLARWPAAAAYQATLYGSLAATGRGHLTDGALRAAFAPAALEIRWCPETTLRRHPNGMEFAALDEGGRLLGSWRAYSVGGGSVVGDDDPAPDQPRYPLIRMDDILVWCEENGRNFWEYVAAHEEPQLDDHLRDVWQAMRRAVARGLETEGVLPGSLHLGRRAAAYHVKAKNTAGFMQKIGLTFAYALAVAEENAAGGEIVTAPTCGSSGVLPAVLLQLQQTYRLSDAKLGRALATAGLFGNLIKHNASISGAEVGCQGEIGAACAMAAAAAAALLGGTATQIEYAAEMGLEHHLGLTCDPVDGLVQIPCIERNAMAAERALECAAYALLSDGRHRVSFDTVVRTMAQTGRDMQREYRETGVGGLARFQPA